MTSRASERSSRGAWRQRRWLFAAASLVAFAIAPLGASARESPEAKFERAATELERSDYDAAIVDLEGLADRGFVHPDVSFDRGIAYAKRAQGKDEQVGDLGKAAAAFEEALLLRPGDKDAESALDAVRAEVTRRRSRRAKDDLIVRPSLDRLVVGLLSERAWSLLAIGSSLLLAVGMILRRRPSGMVHVAGSVLAPVAAIGLAVFTPLAFSARWLREHRKPGVIIVSEVSLVDPNAKGQTQKPIPEASRVEVGDKSGDTIFVRWGSSEGYVPISAVRVLRR